MVAQHDLLRASQAVEVHLSPLSVRNAGPSRRTWSTHEHTRSASPDARIQRAAQASRLHTRRSEGPANRRNGLRVEPEHPAVDVVPGAEVVGLGPGLVLVVVGCGIEGQPRVKRCAAGAVAQLADRNL